MKSLRLHLLSLATLTVGSASAADLFWDGGTANIETNGDGLSTYAGGTWSDGVSNWDAGAGLAHVVWNNGDTAVFAGTYAAGTRTVTIGSNVTVNQIKINTGSTGANRYDIGASSTQNDFAVAFGGSYGDGTPAIDGTATGFLNNNFNAKITGTINGGLVLRHGSDITTPGTSGRFGLTNANNDFTGDIVVVGGNLAASSATAVFGNPANKIVLKGGALFISGGSAGTTTFTRDIDVAAPSGIATNAATAGLQVLDFTGTVTGSADLIRHANVTGSATSDLRLSGDLSGYTGLFENRGNTAAVVTVQSTATSGGSWKLTGGTMKLNTASGDAIADGAGKGDLLMNGGRLDLNGNSETINGLSGATGFVSTGVAATGALLTLGAGDATAAFGGAIQDGAGTVALTKTGGGSQTLSGNNTHTGATTVEAGTLVMGGNLADSPVTVKSGARFTVSLPGKDLQALTLEGGSTLSVPLDTSGGNYLGIDEVLTFSGGSVTFIPIFTESPSLGTYDLILPVAGIAGSASLIADFSANGATRLGGSVQAVDGSVSVTVNSLGASLTWNNATADGQWNVNGAANFLNGAADDVFKQYDLVTFGPASPGGTVVLDGTLLPAAVTVDSADDFTFTGSGHIGGSASLSKSGTGTLTVETSNAFNGDTTVSGGTLSVNGTLGGGDVLVESGATLQGTGILAGAVTVEGTLAPGTGVGELSTGPMTLSGIYACDLDGGTADKLVVTGDLDIGGATLALNVAAPPAAVNYVIATYTGGLTGSFAAAPAGYLIDTSSPGKILLWPEPAAPPAGTITFEASQGYLPNTDIAVPNGAPTDAPFDGTNGWSRSVSSGPGRVVPTASSGEYLGGAALSSNDGFTYIGALRNAIEYTGSNTVSFDAQYTSGIGVGFMEDDDGDGFFDQGSGGTGGDTGCAFGVGGAGPRFQLRLPDFGTETLSPLGGTAGHWYRIRVAIGEVSGGNRGITMTVRNLTTATDLDFDAVTEGIQPWITTVPEAAFGVAPEQADGIFVRVTGAGANGAKIDNLRVTAVNPPVGTAFDTWMDGFPSLAGDDRLPDADPDHDGVTNLLEFVLDGDPATCDPAILPTGSISGDGNLVFTFHRRDDSEGLVAQIVQHGTDLSAWTDVVIGAESGVNYTVEELGAAPDLITVTVPMAGDPKKFIRLLVNGSAP